MIAIFNRRCPHVYRVRPALGFGQAEGGKFALRNNVAGSALLILSAHVQNALNRHGSYGKTHCEASVDPVNLLVDDTGSADIQTHSPVLFGNLDHMKAHVKTLLNQVQGTLTFFVQFSHAGLDFFLKPVTNHITQLTLLLRHFITHCIVLQL
ncbi:hypothetical protein SDC9_102257 [bioreactor metagenome]|uniref:Uncharacterized protein n=1 Tax=bioreactor metagenome TaxID=1076179 RepID=A0A645AQS2_9ZZZZ